MANKRIFSAILVLCLALFPASAKADDGTLENGMHWTYDHNLNILTISGTGAIPDFKETPWHNRGLFTVRLQGDITRIGSNAFNASNISACPLPNTVREIGAGSFARNSQMPSIEIPDSVTKIEQGAFWKCGLQSIALGSRPLNIEGSAFSQCDQLEKIEIPGGAVMGKDAFSHCDKLQSVWVRDHVSMGESAFGYCHDLKTAVIGDGVELGRLAFVTCESLETVTIGQNAAFMGNSAFYDCPALKEVAIGEGLTKIPSSTFKGATSLTSIVLPSSVKEIGLSAFENCEALKTVYYGGSEADWNEIEINKGNTSLGGNNGNNPLLNAKIIYNTVPGSNEPGSDLYVSSVTYGAGYTTVRLSSSSATALFNAAGRRFPVIFASISDQATGRQTAVASGATVPAVNVQFERNLSGGATLFFLHPDTYSPLCKPVLLKPASK